MDTIILIAIVGFALLTFALLFCAISLSITSAFDFARRRLLDEHEVARPIVPRSSLMNPAPVAQPTRVRETPPATH